MLFDKQGKTETLVSKPLVSIGIPTYNRPQTLEQALESILQQTYANLEIIVSDNCSPGQETERLVQKFIERDPRIKYFRHPKNIGLFHNFKFVAEVANGDYFAWLADDDTRSPEFIKTCLEEFSKADFQSNLLLVNTFSEMVDSNTGKIIKIDKGCSTTGLPASVRFQNYLYSIYKDQAAIGDLIYGLVKKQAIQKALSQQPNIISWDHIFLANLALQGEFKTIPVSLMQSAPEGISTSANAVKIAGAQLIKNPIFIHKARWIRLLFLQREILISSNLSPIRKLRLILWCNWYHFKRFIQGFSA